MVEGTIKLVIGIVKVNTGVINVIQFFILVIDNVVMGVNK
jgi:hypothetical protein